MRAPLAKTLRKKLETAVIKARDIAERAAREELQRLTVGHKSPAAYLTEEQRRLRNRLRAHGRQLGDYRQANGQQAIERLLVEVAYEHWHRMLFACFLAENNLLMYEDGVTPLSINDCFDLAEEETNDRGLGWHYAAQYATKMLPQIFRIDSPVFDVNLAPNHQKQLQQLLASLDEATFQAADSLGWVYQFWQTKRKEQINKSEVKIGADELPAVTQLFTEPYMVSFLLDNSLGAWWVANHPEKERPAELTYLRTLEDGTPAAGTFEGWPQQLKELKVLDPCCGSGHFLVAAFLMLVPMRMAEEGIAADKAVDAALRDNIHGLELDKRCVELAAFALALEAWRYPEAGGYRSLPELHVACSGLSVNAAKEEWKHLGLNKKNLSIALDWLHDTFSDAAVLGSLLNPKKTDATKIVQWHELSKTLEQALQQEQSEEQQEAAVVAQGLAKAATLMADQYHWVITNVPYLKSGKQSSKLSDFCDRYHPAAKNDLATVFLDRCLEYCLEGGTTSIVLPQNWLFLTGYKKFREQLLDKDDWRLIARLGAHAFQTPMWDFNVQLLILSRGTDNGKSGGLAAESDTSNLICGLDVSDPRTAAEKAKQLLTAELKFVGQAKQNENPDSRISFEYLTHAEFLADVADYGKGSTTGDAPRFLLYFWEFQAIHDHHVYWLNSPRGLKRWSGRSQVCKVPLNDTDLNSQLGCWLRGKSIYGRKGVVVNKMRQLEPFLYDGEVFDDNICPICPKDDSAIPAILAYVESDKYHQNVRAADQALKVTAATLTKVPFDFDYWSKIAQKSYPNGLPKPYSDDHTQWIFHGHPCGSVIWDEEKKLAAHGSLRTNASILQIAVARLLGYRWPAELDKGMELAKEQREWVEKCQDLARYADDDGIVCLSAVRGEKPAHERLESLLQAAYGNAWSTNMRNKLLEAAACKNKNLDVWLREKFFEQHSKLFQNRPFIWHIWDGLKDGFSALLNYHLLDKKNLERLIYTYLDDWLRTQKLQQADGVDGAAERLAAAQGLKQRLEQILEGEAPYDIFVRWKPLAEQPIGWEPDINDGVRLNIRPFMSVDDVGKKDAGILRSKPNIKWTRDRGKDVQSAPWYRLGLRYGEAEGTRINEHHLKLEEKLTAKQGS